MCKVLGVCGIMLVAPDIGIGDLIWELGVWVYICGAPVIICHIPNRSIIWPANRDDEY